jgi:hypothetical protein
VRHPGPQGWGLGMELTTSSRKKNVVQKPNNQPPIMEIGCHGGQGSPRAVVPSEEEEELVNPMYLSTAAISIDNVTCLTGGRRY